MHRLDPTDDELLITLSPADRARLERLALDDLARLYDRNHLRLEASARDLAADRARLRAVGLILRRAMQAHGLGSMMLPGGGGQAIRYAIHPDGRGLRRERVDAATITEARS